MKNFIYVAGVDYDKLIIGKALDFAVYCRKRQDHMFEQQKVNKEDLFFYIIDMRFGKIHLTEYVYDATANLHVKKTSVYQTFDPVTKANYFDFFNDGHIRFHPNGKNIISKYTIYDLIEKIGTENPGTLEEWGIYSHALADGPILVNSTMHTRLYHDPLDNTEIDVEALGKDPNDYDMRRWDFDSYYRSAANATRLAAFLAALSPTGMLKIYGCNFPRLTNEFMAKVRGNATYKKAGLTNDDIFVFKAGTLSQKMLDWLNPWLGSSYTTKDQASYTFREIKYLMGTLFIYSYQFKACELLNKNVQGSVPATYSETTSEMKISALTLANLEFFKKHFGIKTDDENRNYGIYEPAFDLNSFLL